MFTYLAEAQEIEVLRETFGNRVDSATFWDAEDGGGSFERIDAFDRTGKAIGSVSATDDNFDDVQELARDRGETVQFGLRGIAGDELPPDEQEMADLLDGVRKARAGDSNDDEIEAYRDALEHALTRWPGMSA